MSVILNQLKISNSLNMIGGIYSSVAEAIRIMHDNGYISIYNTANNSRTGYIQGNTGSDLTIAAENGSILQFTTAGSPRLAIATGGNIGIGTTSPVALLDLYYNGAINGPMLSIRSDFTATGKYAMIRFGDKTQTTSYQKGAIIYEGVAGSARGRMHIALENTDTGGTVALSDARLTVQSDGNVGLGTTTPASLLHLIAANTNPPQILLQTSNSSANGSIFWRNSSNSNTSGIASNYNISDGSGNLEFLTGGATTRMTINSSGNVGIGLNPTYKLDVAGAGSGVVGVRLTPDSGKVRLYNYDLLGYNTVNLWLISNGSSNQLTLGTSWDWDTSCDFIYSPGTVGALTGGLVIGQTNKNNANYTHGNTVFYTGGAEKVRITKYGTLLVGDSVEINSSWYNNGIGIFGKNGTDKIVLGYLASSTTGAVIGGHNSALSAWAPLNINGSTLNFRIGETSKMLIDASGNVSISSTTASTSTTTGALTVSGGVGIAGILSVPTLNIGSGTFSFKNYTWNSLDGPNTVGGNRYEIARICIDYNDWNSIGVFEVELFENYYGSGLKKKYNVYYGFVSNYGVKLVEYQGSDAGSSNNFRVTTSGETTVTGDQRYISVYVDVRYYGKVAVRVTTNRQISTSNPPAIGYTYINSSPSATSISDFTADTVVEPCQSAFINITGNLGLGTSSPNAKISVGNNVSTGSIDAYSKYQIITYDGGNGGASYGFGIESNTMWFNSGGGAYKFYRGGSNVSMYMDTSGNIGIGTTSPDQPLAFVDSLGIKIQFNGANANGYQIGLASAVNAGDAMMKFIAGETSAGEFGFYNTTNLRLLIDKYGYVGIGTASPLVNLHIVGDTYSTTGFYVRDSADTFIGSLNGQSGIIVNGTSTDTILKSGGNNSVIIKSTGKVGIGTTSPGAPLSIGRVDSSNEGGQIDLHRASDNASAWAIDVFGNTSTPNLRFVDNIAAAARMTIDGTGVVSIANTTDSSSTTTGALVLSGGLGVAGNIRSASSIYANGNLYIANTLTVTTGSITLEKEGNVYPFNINVYSSTQPWHAPRYLSYRARGTKASPTGVATGDELFSFQASALDNNGNIRNVGNIILSATGTVSGNNIPTKLVFQTCATTAAVDVLTLNSDKSAKFEGGINASALPTSSSGLASGDLWVDTANGNVVKRV